MTALPRTWVLDDPAGEALALANRLDLPGRRLGRGRTRPCEAPALVISAGTRAGIAALTLRVRFGARLLHLSRHAHALLPFDLMVRPAATALPALPRIIPALGPIGVVSPALLARARTLWGDRLDHLPHPRAVLLLRTGSGRRLDRGAAFRLAARVAAVAAAQGGSVLASVDTAVGAEAVAAIGEALRGVLHLLYRSDEPGEDPTLGFLAMADAAVVGGASPQVLSEAAAADIPVFADPLDDRSADGRLLLDTLLARGDIRPFTGALGAWHRCPLDEAGRIAAVLRPMLVA